MTKALLLGLALSSNIGGAASPIVSLQNLIDLQNMRPEPTWGIWFFVVPREYNLHPYYLDPTPRYFSALPQNLHRPHQADERSVYRRVVVCGDDCALVHFPPTRDYIQQHGCCGYYTACTVLPHGDSDERRFQ
jgi:hypothetical protein